MILKVIDEKPSKEYEDKFDSVECSLYQLGDNVKYTQIEYTPVLMLSDDKKAKSVMLFTSETKIINDNTILNMENLDYHYSPISIFTNTSNTEPLTTKDLIEAVDDLVTCFEPATKFYAQKGLPSPLIINRGCAYLMNDEGKTIERL